jgi:hypothetical protein
MAMDVEHRLTRGRPGIHADIETVDGLVGILQFLPATTKQFLHGIPFWHVQVEIIWDMPPWNNQAVTAGDGVFTRVSVHDNGHYMCVFDCRGEQFFIGRVDDVYYLFDHNETLVAKSEWFEVALEALEILLTSRPNGAA